MSIANDYRRDLGEKLAKALGPDWRFYKTRKELRCKTKQGYNSIVLAGGSKWSPYITIAFYFGVNFDKAHEVETEIFKREPSYYHVFQFSYNRNRMARLKYKGPSTWEIDLTKKRDILKPLKRAIEQMAYPFFARFAEIKAARDAEVKCDSWCLTHNSWRNILTLDVALNDLNHFDKWINKQKLIPFEQKEMYKLLSKICNYYERAVKRNRIPHPRPRL